MWSSYLDKEIWLISQSFCVSARDEMGCHSEFSKMLCNLCVVILHQGVQVWALLVGGLNMFKMGGNKSRILHLTSCLGTPPYLGLCVASCQFSLS